MGGNKRGKVKNDNGKTDETKKAANFGSQITEDNSQK